MLILGPLLVCVFVYFFSQATIATIIASLYLLVLSAIVCIYAIKNYRSILLKLGLYPIYQPIPPHTHHHRHRAKIRMISLFKGKR